MTSLDKLFADDNFNENENLSDDLNVSANSDASGFSFQSGGIDGGGDNEGDFSDFFGSTSPVKKLADLNDFF